MTVGELKQMLEKGIIHDDEEIVIQVTVAQGDKELNANVCPIKYAYAGFDWERGKLVLVPDRLLRKLRL